MRPNPLRIDQTAPDRVADQLDPVAHSELAHRVCPMILDRLLGEMEDLGDLSPVVFASATSFTTSSSRWVSSSPPLEPRSSTSLISVRCASGVRNGLAPLDRPDRRQQVGVCLRLQHVAGGARLQRLEEIALVVVHGEDQDRDLRRLAA